MLPRLNWYLLWPPLVTQRSLTGEWPGSCHPETTWRDIQGWFDYADVFDDAIRMATDGDVFVEVGVWRGRSTCYLADAIRISGKRIVHVCVDSFSSHSDDPAMNAILVELARNGRSLRQEFDANLEACGLSGTVRTLQQSSVEAAASFADRSVTFCLIDADHSYASARADITAWLPKVRRGGVLAGHDLHFPGVARAVGEIFGSRAAMAGDPNWPSWTVTVS